MSEPTKICGTCRFSRTIGPTFLEPPEHVCLNPEIDEEEVWASNKDCPGWEELTGPDRPHDDGQGGE